jgi:hypothetical protein
MNAGSGPRWELLHRVLAVLVCVVVPAESWLDGSGARAWTMYARSASYRLRIVTYDANGQAKWMSPSELAAHSAGDLASALAGAETFRVGPEGFALRTRLATLAEFVCSSSGAERVTISLSIRERAGAPSEETTASRSCQRR